MAEFVEIKGLEELQRRLAKIPKELRTGGQSPLRFAARKGAKVIEERAKQLAPVKTGKLRESIKVRLAPRKKAPRDALVFQVKPIKMDHVARWVEFGSGSFAGGKPIKIRKKEALYSEDLGTFFGKEVSGQAPQPFLRPAMEQSFNRVITVFGDELRRKIGLLERKLARGG